MLIIVVIKFLDLYSSNFVTHHHKTLKSNSYFSNVRCMEDDIDITTCPAEGENEFENSCTYEHDVGLRCHESSWAGVRCTAWVVAWRGGREFGWTRRRECRGI